MARIYGEIASSALMTFDKSFSRSNGQPLDSTEVYYSKAAAEAYALTDVAYVGQKLVVIETVDDVTTVAHYGIEADGSLKELGAIPVGDGMTVEVVDGKIQLAALEGHTTGTYQPYLVDGQIEWREPSATTVEGLDSRLTSAEGDIDDLEAAVANVYTKEETDAKFAPVGDYATKEEAQGYADAKDEAIAAAKQAGDDAQADVDALAEKIGEVAEDTTVVQMIADATYDDTELAGRVAAVEGEIGVASAEGVEATGLHARLENLEDLVGTENVADAIAAEATRAQGVESGLDTRLKAVEDDYLKAADKTELEEAIDAAEESAVNRVLGYLAEEEINTSYDTLKEVAAWIESDTTNSAALISRVSAIETDYLKGTDKEALEGEIDALSEFIGDLPEGAASATVVAYIQEVVDGLKIGDYAKAADLTALAERVTALEDKAHEHDNKDVLDGVTAEKVAAWDAAEQNAKDYADSLNTAMTTRVDTIEDAVEGKVDAEDGKSLIADTLIAKLEGIAEGAQVNVIDTVDEAQFNITDKKLTLLDIAISKVTGLQDALDAKANKGTTLAEYGITDAYTKTETETRLQEVLDGLSDTSETAASVAQALETYKTSNDQRVDAVEAKLVTIESGAQANVIEAVKVGTTLLEIVDKTVTIPVGAGLQASDEVTIGEDGTLGIGEVGVSKLIDDGTTLILNGGSAV